MVEKAGEQMKQAGTLEVTRACGMDNRNRKGVGGRAAEATTFPFASLVAKN